MTESDWRNMALLALSWLGYFALHSALASLRVKSWVALHCPERMPLYRLSFNILAVFMLLPILWLMVRNPGPALWAWQGLGAWLANGLALAALFGFMKSLKYYDTQEFLGLRQWKSDTQR
ncbi:MAG: methyltransferase family protein, partial [Sulfuricella sp.]